MQIGGSEGGRRGFTGTSMQSFRWQVPQEPSARLTHGLKPDTVVWLLRCSVLREAPVASAIHFKKPNCYRHPKLTSFAYGIQRVLSQKEPVASRHLV